MIVGLRLDRLLNVEEVLVKGDSKLVIDQIRGNCKVKIETLMKYHAKGVSIAQCFKRIAFEHIPREKNEEADRLSRLATTYYSDLSKGICDQPAYEEDSILNITDMT
ncbi:hypothetical protein LIER_16502 [Lithospermum erythrorhizon]|uniref:RNase H type-1 domain-containing protein n=1 Tax=Lithospermum erythrorhizon TaxID=34254 RepID=A0AAV3Q8A7_LITER